MSADQFEAFTFTFWNWAELREIYGEDWVQRFNSLSYDQALDFALEIVEQNRRDGLSTVENITTGTIRRLRKRHYWQIRLVAGKTTLVYTRPQ